jgi:Mn-containing catalase
MMGLVEEGQEVMQEGEEKEDAAADLALIGAAQRVEHYEISGYMTARNLALQLRHSAVVALLSKSLAEEENADQLLNQVGRTLMSVAKMPAAIEQSGEEVDWALAGVLDTRQPPPLILSETMRCSSIRGVRLSCWS